MSEPKYYIGCKRVQAYPESNPGGMPGYAVIYPDGYKSWSPKEAFESAYLEMGDDPTRISEKMVEDFTASYVSTRISESTTVVELKLRNGFSVVQSSACVDPDNYDHELGIKICKERAKPMIYTLLGFLLKSAVEGFNKR